MAIGLYPGTFDPITKGHVDVIERAAGLFDQVIIAVSNNPAKTTLFTLDERLQMVSDVIKTLWLHAPNKYGVTSWEGLTVDCLAKFNTSFIIRGIRAVSDLEYEAQLAYTNKELRNSTETVFFMPRLEYTYLSSSMVRTLAKCGGKLSHFVHPLVEEKLKEKFDVINGMTGRIKV